MCFYALSSFRVARLYISATATDWDSDLTDIVLTIKTRLSVGNLNRQTINQTHLE